MESEMSEKEIEQRNKDFELFVNLLDTFQQMSLKGKSTTVEALFMGLINELEMEVKQC